jgi:AraC-like DNA-binding protein
LKELWHFVFPLVLSFGNLLNNYYYFLGKYSVVILNIIFVIYAVIYLVFGFLLLKKNVWNRNSKIQIIDVQNNLLHKWTLFLFILYVAISIRLILTLFLDLINSSFSAGKNQLWISGILWSIIFIKILITPEILFGYNALYKKINEQKKSEFSLNEIWILIEKTNFKNQQDEILKVKIYDDLIKNLKNIERLAFEEKSFRKAKTSATEFAKKLEIPKSHLNFIFKYHCKITFTEFKNIIKIYDALQLIESGFLKINTLDALAIKVGFSSYNPFFTSFKDVTGSTPQAYNKQIAQVSNLK